LEYGMLLLPLSRTFLIGERVYTATAKRAFS
jgi:hypothetical protein